MGRLKYVRNRDQKAHMLVDRKTGRIVSKQKTKLAAEYDGVYLTQGQQAALKLVPKDRREA